MNNLFFVDCEARGTSPVNGTLTEFGIVHYATRETFHGVLFEGSPDPDNPAIPLIGKRVDTDENVASRLTTWLKSFGKDRPIFVSDNVAYDWQWIAGMYDRAGFDNPFGHSGRRISDFYAGMTRKWSNTQEWKKYRKTVHDHNPVNDSMGNVEAFAKIMEIAKDTGNISDGYHTFNELYAYRMAYNALLFNEWYKAGKNDVHWSRKHSTGEDCFGGGWFVVVAQTPYGQITNHYELKDLQWFAAIEERERAAEWDGHTPQEAFDRLRQNAWHFSIPF